MDYIGGHVAAIAGEREMTVALLAGAVLQCDHERTFTINRNAHGYAVERLVFIKPDDSGRDIRADHTVSGEADAGGNEAEP